MHNAAVALAGSAGGSAMSTHASVRADPIDMRFPGESESKRKLRKRAIAAQIEAEKRLQRTTSGFASVALADVAQFSGRWAAAQASEQQLQDVLIAFAGLFVAANAFERADDDQPY
jgi:L-rhamnose isomerase